MRKSILSQLFFLLLSLGVALIAFACSSGSDEGVSPSKNVQLIGEQPIGSETAIAEIEITGHVGETYRANIAEAEGSAAWCSFAGEGMQQLSVSGICKGEKTILTIYCDENTSSEMREAAIYVWIGSNENIKLTLSQAGDENAGESEGENEEQAKAWIELPKSVENEDYIYASYETEVGGRDVRNYSLCFSKDKKLALWVAYPLHDLYLDGDGERQDSWSFDPIVDNAYEPDCRGGSYEGSYDRGHQIPSADRLANDAMNDQTFYMTNITPQRSQLNQRSWAELESLVRDNVCRDTLYVVTGAHFDPSSSPLTYTKDDKGNAVPIATHYYKALIRTKSGNTQKNLSDCSADEIQAIGFWVPHDGNISEIDASYCLSIDALEEKCGFDLFPTVDAEAETRFDASLWGL